LRFNLAANGKGFGCMSARFKLRFLALLNLFEVASAGVAWCNDSIVELSTGGLVFEKTPDIEMQSEDLSISEKRIAVRYRFFNRSDVDKHVLVAFPMPEIGPEMNWKDMSVYAVPDSESDNFLDFRTEVDGRRVKTEIEQKAFVKGKDVTGRLQALKIPLLPTAKKTAAALDALPKNIQRELVSENMARDDDDDDGKGMERHILPEWSLRTTYYWKQTFPAGRELAVDHVYLPSFGQYADPDEPAYYKTHFCVDESFLSGAKALQRKAGGVRPSESRIAYVLKTGANWAGPIGEFHLTIDKGTPDTLVSFCESGVTRTGKTTFEVTHKNFTPVRDLEILFLQGASR
jgi:hypothetical protein